MAYSGGSGGPYPPGSRASPQYYAGAPPAHLAAGAAPQYVAAPHGAARPGMALAGYPSGVPGYPPTSMPGAGAVVPGGVQYAPVSVGYAAAPAGFAAPAAGAPYGYSAPQQSPTMHMAPGGVRMPPGTVPVPAGSMPYGAARPAYPPAPGAAVPAQDPRSLHIAAPQLGPAQTGGYVGAVGTPGSYGGASPYPAAQSPYAVGAAQYPGGASPYAASSPYAAATAGAPAGWPGGVVQGAGLGAPAAVAPGGPAAAGAATPPAATVSPTAAAAPPAKKRGGLEDGAYPSVDGYESPSDMVREGQCDAEFDDGDDDLLFGDSDGAPPVTTVEPPPVAARTVPVPVPDEAGSREDSTGAENATYYGLYDEPVGSEKGESKGAEGSDLGAYTYVSGSAAYEVLGDGDDDLGAYVGSYDGSDDFTCSELAGAPRPTEGPSAGEAGAAAAPLRAVTPPPPPASLGLERAPSVGAVEAAGSSGLALGSTAFNERFQAALDLPSATPREALVRARLVRRLVHEFSLEATRIARIIVSERHLPVEAKSIQPVDAGGIAGGQKFRHGSVFIKYVIDDGLYGGDEFAIKSAEHEIKGLRAYLQCGLAQLRTPLFCLVDYRGFRLMCTGVLPLSRDSLAYGSADAGRTVRARNPRLVALMSAAARRINLAGHVVGRTPDVQKLLHSCCDIEGHEGSDGRFYLLDTARVFPPEAPIATQLAVLVPARHAVAAHEVRLRRGELRKHVADILGLASVAELAETQLKGDMEGVTLLHRSEAAGGFKGGPDLLPNVRANKMAVGVLPLIFGDVVVVGRLSRVPHLVRLLRPELVRCWSKPLSSDAYTLFGQHNAALHNSRVRAATECLRERLVRNFADSLSSFRRLPSSGAQLVEMMHECGINVRYMGLIRTATSRGHIMRLRLLTEMIARVVKSMLTERLRALSAEVAAQRRSPHADGTDDAGGGSTSAHDDDDMWIAYAKCAASVFNRVFGQSHATRVFWTTTVKARLLLKFGEYARPHSWRHEFQCFVPDATVLNDFAESHPLSDLRAQVFKLALFGALQRQTGVLFTVATNRRLQDNPLIFEQENPFQLEDIEDLRCTVNAISGDAELLKAVQANSSITAAREDDEAQLVELPPIVAPADDSQSAQSGPGGYTTTSSRRGDKAKASADSIEYDEAAWNAYATATAEVFGVGSSQAAAALLRQARHASAHGKLAEARKLVDTAAARVLPRVDCDADTKVAVWFLLGSLDERVGRLRPALESFQRALGTLEQHYGAGLAFEMDDPADQALATVRNADTAAHIAIDEYRAGIRAAAAALQTARKAKPDDRAALREARATFERTVAACRRDFDRAKMRAFHGAVRRDRDKQVFRAHPLAAVLADRVVALMLSMAKPELAKQFPHPSTYGNDPRLRRSFREKAREYCDTLPHPADPELCRRFFGFEVPLSELFEPLHDLIHPNHGTALALMTEKMSLNLALSRLPEGVLAAVRAQRQQLWRDHATRFSASGDADVAREAWISQVEPFFDPGALLERNPFHSHPVVDGGADDAPPVPADHQAGMPWSVAPSLDAGVLDGGSAPPTMVRDTGGGGDADPGAAAHGAKLDAAPDVMRRSSSGGSATGSRRHLRLARASSVGSTAAPSPTASDASGGSTPRGAAAGGGAGGSKSPNPAQAGAGAAGSGNQRPRASGVSRAVEIAQMAPAEVGALGGAAVRVEGYATRAMAGSAFVVYCVHVNTVWPELAPAGAAHYVVERRWSRVKHFYGQVTKEAKKHGVALPELPGMSSFGSFLRSVNQEERATALDAFMCAIIADKRLARSPPVIKFLKQP